MEPWCGEDIDKPDTCINFDKKMGFTILRIFGYIQSTLWKKKFHQYPNLNQITLLL